MCEQGVETDLAKKSFLRFGDGHEPLIRKGGVYFVKAQTVNAWVLADGCTNKTREYNLMGDQKTDEYEPMGAQSVRVDKSEKSCVQTEKVQNPCGQNRSCVRFRQNDGVEIIHNNQRNHTCQNADVKPSVRDPMDDDRVLCDSVAEMTPVPHEPSEFERQKHHLTHIPFKTWCTSCVKAKAQAEPHKRTAHII